ncbi:MAG: glycosyltransferase [Clostridia bacterium]|nr:glycosyltransferase [Clostridia bacterium]
MLDFILNIAFWTLAIYGLIEIIKNIINIAIYTKWKSDGIFLIVATKNQEDNIEGFLRSSLFKITYGKEDYIKNIIVADLNSKDKTVEIAKKLSDDYDCIKVTNWKECKNILDNIDEC